MKIGPAGLGKIARMICGDDPFTYFPYRSSSYLTQFFEDLDLDYVHDGSTRARWVKDVLVELNAQTSDLDTLPSTSICHVIEYLLHPDHFQLGSGNDHERAIKEVSDSLRSYGLTIGLESRTRLPRVATLQEGFVSGDANATPPEKVITFSPNAFRIPEKDVQEKMVSVMMPFSREFDEVYEAIKNACTPVGLFCVRADDIWNNETVIQDIFEIIYCSTIVVVDFSGKNSNVMYEAGIAHTLGKHVVPITQSINDVPFDLRHHRALKYLANAEGLKELAQWLTKRLTTLTL